MAYRSRQMKDSDPGTLTVAATPLGQPADASPRLAAALAAAQLIAAEDTRRVLRLARELGVRLTGRLISYYNGVDKEKSAEFLAALKAGTDVLLIAEAGMPGVSDPGYRLVGAAADAGITVTVLPGPSAVTAALAVSGLPTDRFCFEGFPPRGAGPRRRRFEELAAEPGLAVLSSRFEGFDARIVEHALQQSLKRPDVRLLHHDQQAPRRRTLSSDAAHGLPEVLEVIVLHRHDDREGIHQLSVRRAAPG